MGTHTVKVNGVKLLSAPKGSSSEKSERRKIRKLRENKKDLEGIASKFGLSTKEITRMIDKGDAEKAVGYFQKKMLAAVINLIPIAERKYKKYGTQGHAYAMNAMISTARELAQDLQATGDRQKLALSIMQEILMPGMRAIVQSMVDEHYNLKRDLRDYTIPKKVAKMEERVQHSGQRIARHANQVYENMSQRVTEALIR